MNDAGNLFDAAGLGAMAALKNAKLPEVDENGVIDYMKRTDKSLPVSKEALPVTVRKIQGQFVVDPLFIEEQAVDARLTVASTADGSIVALQKGGDAPFSIEEIGNIVDIALEKAKFLREKLNQALR